MGGGIWAFFNLCFKTCVPQVTVLSGIAQHYTTKKFAYITLCFPDTIETVFTGSCFIAVLVDEFLLIFADAVL